MNQQFSAQRKIGPGQIDPTAQRPDGTPLDNDRAEIGPTPLAFAEWAEAGLEMPDIPAMRRFRHARLVDQINQRGYGAACLAGIDALDPRCNVVLFMDADLSDVPEEADSLLAPIVNGEADMVIGSRVLGEVAPGAMSAPQRFGNWLAPALARLIWNVDYTDLGPFRAIRRDTLETLGMEDRDFGWTIEMQVRAAKRELRIAERPVSYRRRVGVSKISGTVRGVILAGWKILYVIAREAFGDFDRAANPPETSPSNKGERTFTAPQTAKAPATD